LIEKRQQFLIDEVQCFPPFNQFPGKIKPSFFFHFSTPLAINSIILHRRAAENAEKGLSFGGEIPPNKKVSIF
jgi:hypothetical protein